MRKACSIKYWHWGFVGVTVPGARGLPAPGCPQNLPLDTGVLPVAKQIKKFSQKKRYKILNCVGEQSFQLSSKLAFLEPVAGSSNLNAKQQCFL